MEFVELYNGVRIPNIAYGSAITDRYRYYSNSNKSRLKYYIKNFIKNRAQYKKDMGLKKILKKEKDFILIDTSRAYAGSENIIGKYAGKNSIICTKICNSDQLSGNLQKGFETSLKALDNKEVDILLMHWPVKDKYIDTWKYMEKIYKEGKVKAIGVCNCNIHHLEKIRKECEIMPMINQFECHPLFTQSELRDYCRDNRIKVMAYTATARMDDRLYNTILPDLQRKYNKSITQIIIRWHIQLGNIPIVNTSNVEHYINNKAVFDFELTDEEMTKISSANINSRLRYDPDNCDFSRL